MIHVALITSWNERCGIAEYAKNLTAQLSDVSFTILDRQHWSTPDVLNSGCEIVHVNYEPGLMRWITMLDVQRWRAAGRKTVITWHTSQESGNRTPFHSLFDQVVMHEPTTDGFVHIPHGIEIYPEIKNGWMTVRKVGTAGFPFPWKGFPEVAEAAKMLDMGVMVLAPASEHADTHQIEPLVKQRHPNADYRTQWYTTFGVIGLLSHCEVTVFAYHDANHGISGAVRLGLAAGRPIVLSRNRQFRDLFPYEDEIEFVDRPEAGLLAAGITRVLESGKRPRRVLEDMSWQKTAGMYRKLYEELV